MDGMERLRDMSLVLEGSKYVTCSTVLLHIMQMLYGLWAPTRLKDKTMVYQTFVEAVKSKLLDLVDDVNQFYSWAMCAFLDGRHKELTWLEPIFQHPDDWPNVTQEYPSLRELQKIL